MFGKILPRWKLSPSLSKFCQARVNILLFRCLPFRLSRWYLGLIGRLYFLLKWREKALICRTVALVLGRELPDRQVKAAVKETFRGIIDHYHEKLFVAYSNFKRLLRFLDEKIQLRGEEALRRALAAGKGVILVTGHYGAVEFLPGCLAIKGFPVSMICRFQTSRLRASLFERARRVNLNLIDADGGNIFLAALRALKAGQILITECDEFDEWRPTERHYFSFLKAHLQADRTLDLLHKRSGAPVITAFLERNGQKRYTLHLEAVSNGRPEAAPVGVQCLAVLEEAIWANPAQWYQWKKFGQMILPAFEAEHACPAHGYLAPEAAVSLSV
ncbi:MAG: lysophospholipid acyltransferase family protein [Deltaproteobacteria bacterium]|nr:lysophospholipid acyltransferase family protein [Deltaproteobacteria bacterium]